MSKTVDDSLQLNKLTVPFYVSHVKPGSSLATNGDIVVIQDGSTTLEIRTAPKFEPKKLPWRDGLIRDIIWSSDLQLFFLLTQKNLFAFDPQTIVAPSTTTINTELQFKVLSFTKIKPIDESHTFWRCTCVGSNLFLSYSGFGTIIDEYKMSRTSCQFVDQWTSPKTCSNVEGIWCIRYQTESDQIGLTIMNSQTNQWRFEIRDRKKLSTIWQTGLPVNHGDCELTSLGKDQWLIINSCGVRLVHVINRKLKAAVEYERELRNAILIGRDYFVLRTKSTIEVHSIKKEDVK